jgi:hypothetical protein
LLLLFPAAAVVLARCWAEARNAWLQRHSPAWRSLSASTEPAHDDLIADVHDDPIAFPVPLAIRLTVWSATS